MVVSLTSLFSVIHPKESPMPFVNVKLVEGVFTTEEKHAMAKALTEVMVKFEGSEAFREVVWVLIEELHTDGWHIGGRPFAGPKSLMESLGRSKSIFEMIDGNPKTRQEFAKAAPPLTQPAE
jgi:4-oxalocrotonate tautomerase